MPRVIPALRRLTLLVPCSLAVAVVFAAAASAHVEATGEGAPDGTSTVTFSFHHGCDGAATTGLRIQLPTNVANVVPAAPEGWSADVTDDGTLSWSGGSVPDDEEASFVVSMLIPGTAGDTIFFPTVQQCGSAEESWIDKSEDPEADHAAPRIVLAADVAEPAPTTIDGFPPQTELTTTTASDTGSISSSDGEIDEQDDDDGSVGPVVVAVGIGALVVLAGGLIGMRRRAGDAATGDSAEDGPEVEPVDGSEAASGDESGADDV